MSTGHSEKPPGDAGLIQAVREGSTEAYGELYERHVGAARSLARYLCPSPSEADDAVSEAFAKMLQVLQDGGGPDEAFRAYLLRALRNKVYDRARRDKKISFTDDLESQAPAEPFVDTAEAELERSLAARAFKQLPERWQTVLWHTAVEDQSPSDVATILGTSPNNVTSLAYRAREGLRQAYLDCYLADDPDNPCAQWVGQLGAHARGGLSARNGDQLDQHLAGCPSCTALFAELRDVSGSMRAVLGPVVLGAAAAGYFAQSQAGAVVATHLLGAVAAKWWLAAGAAATTAAITGGVYVLPRSGDQPPPQARPTAAQAALTPSPSSTTTGPLSGTTTGPPTRTKTKRPTTSDQQAGATVNPKPTSKSSGAPPRPTTSSMAPPPPPDDAAVSLSSTEQDARTTVTYTVANRTGSSGAADIFFSVESGMEFDSSGGGCTMTGQTADTMYLDCGRMAVGATKTGNVVLRPVKNPDGTYSDQEGAITADLTVGTMSSSTSEYVRVINK
jgi:RNA polymerase sigma factor (sigma-70 family)